MVGGLLDKDRFLPVGVAFCIMAGLVLSRFPKEPRPPDYLIRPLLVVAVISLILGLASSVLDTAGGPVAAVGSVWLLKPNLTEALIALGLLGVLIAYRLWRGYLPDVRKPLAVGAGVFLVVGVLPILPLISRSLDTKYVASKSVAGPPIYMILLDGYPRADTLAAHGFDISRFLTDLSLRGFDIYPNATSHHVTTFRTITHMLTGEPMDGEGWGEVDERRATRNSWQLPVGFVSVAPPFGPVTLPNDRTLNPGGFTIFEAELLSESIFGAVSGDYVMDGMRSQLQRSLRLIAETDERRVFAHLLAPHMPFLYSKHGPAPPPPCWPGCHILDNSYSVRELISKTGDYVIWLNPHLTNTIDHIINEQPDAEIVLFSDHGGRFTASTLTDDDEWHRVFLAARTPSRRQLFLDTPHPSALFAKLLRFSEAIERRESGS